VLGLTALLLAGQALAATVESIVIPGSTVTFDLARIPGVKNRFGAFAIGAHEVTWDEYELYQNSGKDEKVDGVTRPTQPDVENPRNPFQDGTVQTGRFPARSIGWYGAAGYCAWLSHKTGRRFRLPTEPEWEAAVGAKPDPDQAWSAGNSKGHAQPVGTLAPNSAGVYDLLGNVWELSLEPNTPQGDGGVVRGGGFDSPPWTLAMLPRKRIPVEEWHEGDPKRPVRAWWLTSAPFVGFRVVAEDDDRVGAESRAAAIRRISTRNVKVVDPGSDPYWLARVTGELEYAGGDALDEVEIEVCFTDAKGVAIRVDPRAKPAFGLAWPVLASTVHRDGRQNPLRGMHQVPFSVEVPIPFDEVGAIPHGAPVVKVTWVHFAP